MEGPESNITITYSGNGNGNRYYTTLDSYIAGYLFDLGHNYELVSDGSGKFSFRYTVSDALLQALHDYQSGSAIVNALQFSRTVKALRGEILRRKGVENGSIKNFRAARQ